MTAPSPLICPTLGFSILLPLAPPAFSEGPLGVADKQEHEQEQGCRALNDSEGAHADSVSSGHTRRAVSIYLTNLPAKPLRKSVRKLCHSEDMLFECAERQTARPMDRHELSTFGAISAPDVEPYRTSYSAWTTRLGLFVNGDFVRPKVDSNFLYLTTIVALRSLQRPAPSM